MPRVASLADVEPIGEQFRQPRLPDRLGGLIQGISAVDGRDHRTGDHEFPEADEVAGEAMASLVATGKTPELIAPFDLARFTDGWLVGERGAAAVGH